MERIKSFLFLNGLLNGYPIHDILAMANISEQELATEILGCSTEDLPSLIERIDSADKEIDATDLTKTFLNFYRTRDYAFAYAGDGTLPLVIEKLRELVIENPKIPPQTIANVLQCTFSKVHLSKEYKMSDGILYCPAGDEEKIPQSMMEAFILYYNCNSLLKPAQLKALRKCVSARQAFKTLTPDMLSRIINACLKKGYHPCVLSKTCLEICNYLPLYAETGIIAERYGTKNSDIVLLLRLYNDDDYVPYVLSEPAFIRILSGEVRGAANLRLNGTMLEKVGG